MFSFLRLRFPLFWRTGFFVALPTGLAIAACFWWIGEYLYNDLVFQEIAPDLFDQIQGIAAASLLVFILVIAIWSFFTSRYQLSNTRKKTLAVNLLQFSICVPALALGPAYFQWSSEKSLAGMIPEVDVLSLREKVVAGVCGFLSEEALIEISSELEPLTGIMPTRELVKWGDYREFVNRSDFWMTSSELLEGDGYSSSLVFICGRDDTRYFRNDAQIEVLHFGDYQNVDPAIAVMNRLNSIDSARLRNAADITIPWTILTIISVVVLTLASYPLTIIVKPFSKLALSPVRKVREVIQRYLNLAEQYLSTRFPFLWMLGIYRVFADFVLSLVIIIPLALYLVPWSITSSADYTFLFFVLGSGGLFFIFTADWIYRQLSMSGSIQSLKAAFSATLLVGLSHVPIITLVYLVTLYSPFSDEDPLTAAMVTFWSASWSIMLVLTATFASLRYVAISLFVQPIFMTVLVLSETFLSIEFTFSTMGLVYYLALVFAFFLRPRISAPIFVVLGSCVFIASLLPILLWLADNTNLDDFESPWFLFIPLLYVIFLISICARGLARARSQPN